jgi:hypothetical protein
VLWLGRCWGVGGPESVPNFRGKLSRPFGGLLSQEEGTLRLVQNGPVSSANHIGSTDLSFSAACRACGAVELMGSCPQRCLQIDVYLGIVLDSALSALSIRHGHIDQSQYLSSLRAVPCKEISGQLWSTRDLQDECSRTDTGISFSAKKSNCERRSYTFRTRKLNPNKGAWGAMFNNMSTLYNQTTGQELQS